MRIILALIIAVVLWTAGCSKDQGIDLKNNEITEKITLGLQNNSGENEIKGEDEGKKGKMVVIDLPTSVQSIIKKTYPGGVIEEASMEKENKRTVYDIEIAVQGSEYDVEVTSEGLIIEVSEEIEINSLPEIITQSLKEAYPGSIIKEAEKVIENENETYEVKIISADRELEVTLDTTGKVLTEEMENEDEDNANRNHEFKGEEEGEN